MPLPLVQCAYCRHFKPDRRDGNFCTAYPFAPGIPLAIIQNQHDHRKPFDGDNGVRFSPISGESSPFEDSE